MLGSLDNSTRGGALALLPVTLLVFAASGCGETDATASSRSTSTRDASPTQTAPVGGYLKLDADADTDDERSRVRTGADEQPLLRSYGPRASSAEARAIAALVKSYYAVSAAGDAAHACLLLTSTLAEGLATDPGQPGGGRQGCAGPMSALLRQQHSRFVAEGLSTMVIVAVHVKGDFGLAVLGFRATPESQIVLQREGGAWKIGALFGSYMP